jgi:uncharacterized protein YbaP (TraB family)
MMNLLAAAALAAGAPGAPIESASPAIFEVRDADTTVYIFGTFHALDGRSHWFNNEVRTAFDRSGELILETVIPEGPAQAPAPRPISPGAMSVTPSASYLATTKMAINAGREQGMKVAHGADMVLRREADLSGKYVEGLETLESQLNMFQRMPAATQPSRPKAGAPVDDGKAEALSNVMAEMQAAWKRGDQRVFVRILDQLNRSSPDTYRMMFTERNARWADWVAARMQTPGTVFVAVGAGHLVGKDSLLVRLAEQGIESTRLN